MPTTTKRAKTSATKSADRDAGLSDVEREALKETLQERKRAPRRGSPEERAQGERDIEAKIAEMVPSDRAMAERIHELVTSAAPELVPRTFYGMPAYAKDGKVICFFQPAAKFKVRYSTFGFQPDAKLDDGEMWPASFALTRLTPAAEKRIVELVRRAAS
jgi:uncharacterized protein YdhG (YjbR/CyaY superfamily)